MLFAVTATAWRFLGVPVGARSARQRDTHHTTRSKLGLSTCRECLSTGGVLRTGANSIESCQSKCVAPSLLQASDSEASFCSIDDGRP